MAERFSLKDHLFNPDTIAQLSGEYAKGIPRFDATAFQRDVLAGFADRELLERLDWMADCLEPYLPGTFGDMADQLEAAMPDALDPSLTDDDFGQFIHAVPGILAVRHGLEDDPERALDLLYEATKRFSMESYIRPFLNRWPEDTLARLETWTQDPNYHVRRLVSEGTRPKLPWAKAVHLTTDQTLPLLDKLHADPTRYVTRSVANHLNDVTKSQPDLAIDRLEAWAAARRQTPPELLWMTRHALRTQIKEGAPRALRLLGYDPDIDLDCDLTLPDHATIGGAVDIQVRIVAKQEAKAMVDYVLHFATPTGRPRAKVFKLKDARLRAGEPMTVSKAHRLKGDATTFTLHPGPHRVAIQINGQIRAEAGFALEDASD